MPQAIDRLRRQLEGEVKDDLFTRHAYSVDASLYRLLPVAVVTPKSRADIQAALAWAREEGLPVVPRGAATGIAGGAIGAGLVIDCSRYLTRILDVDYQAGLARCEPGVVQDQLNAYLAPRGFRFGPDTSTGNRATLGGMLGNNASGAHSLRYGKTIDNVHSLEVLLAEGEVLRLEQLAPGAWERLAAGQGREADIYRTLLRLKTELHDEIAARFPRIERRVAGYNLDELIQPGPLHMARLFTGSEGSLGLASELIVKIAPDPKYTGLCVMHFADLVEGLGHVEYFLQFQPFSLELIDNTIIADGRHLPMMRGQLDWLHGDPDGLIVAEFEGDSEAEVVDKLAKFEAGIGRERICHDFTRLTRKADCNKVWALRKAGLGILLSRRSADKGIAFVEDTAVAPAKIGAWCRTVRDYTRARGHEVGMYGHAGAGCVHIRPMLDLTQARDLDLMVQMMEDFSDHLLQLGGSVTGEHGDGLVRSWLHPKMFGPQLYRAFQELKLAFDPQGRMNPGKVVANQGPRDNLRISPATRNTQLPTCFSFAADGGFEFAVNMCNGNAECRKLKVGTMCPSYEATGDEFYSTRARATSLQAIVQGLVPLDELTGDELQRVLEFCLQCKACKKECPSQVDMAKLKSEVLYQYQKVHGLSLRSWLFGSYDLMARLGSAFAPLSNYVAAAPPSKAMMSLMGIAPQRDMMPFARQTFSRWFARHRRTTPPQDGPKVFLFVDCYLEYNHPELGQAAVRVLEAAGCHVAARRVGCCGRPAISKGMLADARAKLAPVLAALAPVAREGYTIVGIEPSCVAVLTDDALALCPGEQSQAVASASRLIDDFLASLLRDGKLPIAFRRSDAAEVHLHGHCHQKSLYGTSPTLQVLQAVPGFQVREIDSGCCGMAGSFGYEKEHYEFSLKVGESRLFPAIRKLAPAALLVADGISCRQQIKHGTQRRARHLVEILAERL